jgi:hypothetical protein
LAALAATHPELRRLNLWGTAVTDDALVHLAKMRELRVLFLNFTSLSGVGIAPLLERLPHLEVFQIGHLKSADEAAKVLSQSGALKTLMITHSSDFTDQGLMYLGKIKTLEELDIVANSKVTSAGLADLAGLPHLVSLRLQKSSLSDEGAAFLSQMQQLTRLEIVSQHSSPEQILTDRGYELLSRLVNLRELRMRKCKLSEAALAHVARMPNLTLIALQDCALSDDAALSLAESKSLTTLILTGSPISPPALERLRAARPEVDIQLKGN